MADELLHVSNVWTWPTRCLNGPLRGTWTQPEDLSGNSLDVAKKRLYGAYLGIPDRLRVYSNAMIAGPDRVLGICALPQICQGMCKDAVMCSLR